MCKGRKEKKSSLKTFVVFFFYWSIIALQIPGGTVVKSLQVRPLGREDPLEQEMATHFSILAWKFHGQQSLVGPWGCKKLDTTEHYPYNCFTML